MTAAVRFSSGFGASAAAGDDQRSLDEPPTTTFVITGLGRGGAETQLVALCRDLVERGWPIEVVSLLPLRLFTDARFVGDLEDRGIPVWSPGIAGFASGVRGLWRLLVHLRVRKPRVLCTFMFHANVAGVVLGRLAGVPVVISSIRNERFGPGWRERLEAMTQRLADVTVVNADRVRTSLRARGIVRDGRCRVIPNAVDVARFAPGDRAARESMRRRLGVPPDGFLWLAVGSLEPQKDHETLLGATARVRERHPSLRLAIAGEGPRRGALGTLSLEMGLDDTVSWLGLRDDVPDLLSASDAFVLSSRWEGSPNALLEALAAGVPAVATDVGGVGELVGEGWSGFLVPPADVEVLAGAMACVMALSSDERRRMGRRGRDAVRQRHGAPAVLAHWRQLLMHESAHCGRRRDG